MALAASSRISSDLDDYVSLLTIAATVKQLPSDESADSCPVAWQWAVTPYLPLLPLST